MQIRKSLSAIAVFLMLFLGPAGFFSPCFAMTDQEVETSINELLMQRHPVDSAQTWLSFGPGAPRVIIAMYGKTNNAYYRQRLIHALGWFDDPVAVDFLKQQAQDAADDLIRNQAIQAIATSQGAREADFVSKFLENKNPQTRLTAATSLRGMQDAHATQIYEKYLSEEKATWVVQKLKGQISPPPGALKPVASSEDRLSSDFFGTWNGFFLSVKAGQQGLQSEAAILRFKGESATDITGDLTLKAKDKIRNMGLKNLLGKASHLRGMFTETLAAPQKGPAQTLEFPFEADLTQEGGNLLLRFRLARQGDTLVVRKQP